jgi:F0F1-type ATP synthase assembly protein I
MVRNREKKEPNENPRQSLNALARYSGMAFLIGAPIVIGILGGKWLDDKLSMKFQLFTVVLTLTGVFLGVYLVVRDLLKQK